MLDLRRAQRRTLLAALILLHLQQDVHAQDPFDCHVALDGGLNYDLTSIAGEHVVTRTRDTPPSRILDEVRFDLCGDLPKRDGVADQDQCPSGSRACMTLTSQKGDEGDRVIAVIPLAVSSELKPDVSALASPNKGLNLIFHGKTYPETEPRPQSLNLTLHCDTTSSDPSFVSYDGEQLRLEWRTAAGCNFDGNEPSNGGDKEGEGDNGGKEEEKVGSGIGWFFLLLLLAFVAYFVLGAYHNYSTYGATGADLIPHRDFWREVPYVLRDIASHLCSALRPSPRNGYIAV